MFSRSLRPLCSLNLALRRFFSSSYLLIVSVSYSDGSQHDRCRSGPWSERDSSSWCPSRSHSETASGSLILVADDQSFLCICVPCHRGITWCVLLFLHTLDRARSEILFFFCLGCAAFAKFRSAEKALAAALPFGTVVTINTGSSSLHPLQLSDFP